jgi:hypothetical protein
VGNTYPCVASAVVIPRVEYVPIAQRVVGMVQNVECLRSNLQVHGLGKVETFVDGEVPCPEPRRAEGLCPRFATDALPVTT